jgi:tRNA threonylcarbamoyladenosine biosynthesis protein TsaB
LALILNIDTATTSCSAALFDKDQLIAIKELDAGYTHAENLHLFIDSILKQSGHEPKDLQAIAISRGPGSYTGLRIGASTAKGLAYALNIPLIAVDTLMLMAAMARSVNNEAAYYCPMIDAGRMEVYTSVYNNSFEQKIPIEALIVDETSIQIFEGYKPIAFFGNGMPKCQQLLSALPETSFIEAIQPGAKYMGALSYQKYLQNEFADKAYFEPFYLKEFMIKKKA